MNKTDSAMKKAKFVEGVMMGMTATDAYKRAGYKHSRNGIAIIQKDEWVKEQLQKVINMTLNKGRTSRETVEGIVLEAIDIARIKAEPGDMIRGASELSKMNGYYAAEKKEISVEGHIEIQQMEAMSDTELLELLGNEPDAIEAEFERIDG